VDRCIEDVFKIKPSRSRQVSGTSILFTYTRLLRPVANRGRVLETDVVNGYSIENTNASSADELFTIIIYRYVMHMDTIDKAVSIPFLSHPIPRARVPCGINGSIPHIVSNYIH